MDQPYQPISCDIHDAFLSNATLRRQVELSVAQADGQAVSVQGVIADVFTREGAEYLQLKDGQTFRLDRVVAMDGKPLV